MQDFLRPDYDNGCFADLPALIRHCLTGEPVDLPAAAQWGGYLRRYDTVILVLVDAFGWRFFEQFANRPLLRRFSEQGAVLRWTSQFPSTTAAHITCLNTGLTPGQSGVYEWQFYEPALDAVLQPLLFSFAGEEARETLQPTGIGPEALYPSQTFYQTLQADGVASYVYQPREYVDSTYSRWMLRGAAVRGYRTLPEGLVNLRRELPHTQKPAYVSLYFPLVDYIGHFNGPDSPQMAAEIEACLFSLERALFEPLAGRLENALLIFTADHGMVDVSPQRTLYLNSDRRFAGLERFLRTDRQGRLLPPGGSARDVFLYIKPAALDEAHAFLATRLAGVAEVRTARAMLDEGYFGPPPYSDRFLARLGNLVILPDAGEAVWWYEEGRFEQKFYGHHGGLTPAEMEIPVGLLPSQ